jgi:hypothetical protein
MCSLVFSIAFIPFNFVAIKVLGSPWGGLRVCVSILSLKIVAYHSILKYCGWGLDQTDCGSYPKLRNRTIRADSCGMRPIVLL